MTIRKLWVDPRTPEQVARDNARMRRQGPLGPNRANRRKMAAVARLDARRKAHLAARRAMRAARKVQP